MWALIVPFQSSCGPQLIEQVTLLVCTAFTSQVLGLQTCTTTHGLWVLGI